RDPRIPPLAQQLGVREETAEVRVSGGVLSQQHDVGIARGWSGRTHGEGSAEDGLHTVALTRRDEPGGPVEAAAIGHRDRRHPQTRGLLSHLLRGERSFLQGEVAADIEVNEGHEGPSPTRTYV